MREVRRESRSYGTQSSLPPPSQTSVIPVFISLNFHLYLVTHRQAYGEQDRTVSRRRETLSVVEVRQSRGFSVRLVPRWSLECKESEVYNRTDGGPKLQW